VLTLALGPRLCPRQYHYICVFIHIYIYVYMYIYIYIHIHRYSHIYACIYILIHPSVIRRLECSRLRWGLTLSSTTSLYMYMYRYIHICIHVYIYIYIHTYIHTYKHRSIYFLFYTGWRAHIGVGSRLCARQHRAPRQGLRGAPARETAAHQRQGYIYIYIFFISFLRASCARNSCSPMPR